MTYLVGERGPEVLMHHDSETTVEQIDEALFHASLVPVEERGAFWRKWTDALTDQRNRLEQR